MKLYSYCVYILECSDGSYYTGVTNDMERRLLEHAEGMDTSCYTYSRRPVIMRYFEQYQYINDAIQREKQIKGWSRKKKEALMRGDIEELRRLAMRRRNDS